MNIHFRQSPMSTVNWSSQLMSLYPILGAKWSKAQCLNSLWVMTATKRKRYELHGISLLRSCGIFSWLLVGMNWSADSMLKVGFDHVPFSVAKRSQFIRSDLRFVISGEFVSACYVCLSVSAQVKSSIYFSKQHYNYTPWYPIPVVI